MIARAYCNWGRWVVDCPRTGCFYAFKMEPGQGRMLCRAAGGAGCGMDAPVEWPPDVADIDKVLSRRPLESTRNWFPANHDMAVRGGLPHGQTVADLVAETDMHARS